MGFGDPSVSVPFSPPLAPLEWDWFDRYQAVALSIQMIACLLFYLFLLLRTEVDPGRNIKGQLAGLALGPVQE